MHSLQRGGVLAAWLAGVDIENIKSHVRWRSDAVRAFTTANLEIWLVVTTTMCLVSLFLSVLGLCLVLGFCLRGVCATYQGTARRMPEGVKLGICAKTLLQAEDLLGGSSTLLCPGRLHRAFPTPETPSGYDDGKLFGRRLWSRELRCACQSEPTNIF